MPLRFASFLYCQASCPNKSNFCLSDQWLISNVWLAFSRCRPTDCLDCLVITQHCNFDKATIYYQNLIISIKKKKSDFWTTTVGKISLTIGECGCMPTFLTFLASSPSLPSMRRHTSWKEHEGAPDRQCRYQEWWTAARFASTSRSSTRFPKHWRNTQPILTRSTSLGITGASGA